MDNNAKDACQTNGRARYQPPQLYRWGAVSDLTRLGGSGGPGDLFYNPAGKLIGNPDDGSVTPGFAR